MVTEIFTGHAINLNDIRAISGLKVVTKQATPFYYQSLVVTINLVGGTELTYEAIKLKRYRGVDRTEAEVEKWNKAYEVLTLQRDELVDQWKQAGVVAWR